MPENLLRPLARAWSGKLAIAKRAKREFDDVAQEGMLFFDSNYHFLYDPSSKYSGFVNWAKDEAPIPTFQMCHNRVAELVQLFLPQLMHRNPVRTVTPRQFPDLPIQDVFAQQMQQQMQQQMMQMAGPGMPPEMAQQQAQMYVQMMMQQQMMQVDQARRMDQARAIMMETIQNYTPRELKLKWHSRMALTEVLITGIGFLMVELDVNQYTGQRLPGSFWVSQRRVLVDPDADSWEEAKWIAIEYIEPVWDVERRRGYEPGMLKGNMESGTHQGATDADREDKVKRAQGRTNDLMRYWKVFSKMGMGARLAGEMGGAAKLLREELDQFGDNCYLEISDNVEYPLNLPPEFVDTADDEQIMAAVQWPTPYWHIKGGWPVKPIVFHEKPNSVWPVSHIKPALGELRFLNWAYSSVASKIRTTSRDFVAILKAAGEELKHTIQRGGDLSVLEIETAMGTRSIGEIVQFLQHPPFNGDIWTVVSAVERSFEKRTGLMELLYGETETQDRSAAGTRAKMGNLGLRPGDMRECFEQAMSDIAVMEALCARVHLDQNDVMPILGPMGAQAWGMLIMTADVASTVTQLEYQIESGSTAKPNKEAKQENMTMAIQTMLPITSTYTQATGDVGPTNNLLHDWAEAMDIPNPDRYAMQPPPPPMPPPGAEGQPAEQPAAA